jgi:hypothetical protein
MGSDMLNRHEAEARAHALARMTLVDHDFPCSTACYLTAACVVVALWFWIVL